MTKKDKSIQGGSALPGRNPPVSQTSGFNCRCLLVLLVILMGSECSVRPSIARDIYLAIRRDGQNGSGRMEDPFDASSAEKYDSLLVTFPENTNFHYAPGTYETHGGRLRIRPTANPNCHHFGAGIDQTIIRLVGTTHETEEGIIFTPGFGPVVDGFELHDLTLDCNADVNCPPRNGRPVGAVNVVGNNILLSHLKVIGFGTQRKGSECFPVMSWSNRPGEHYRNVRLEDSIFTQPASGNKDGVSCAALAGTNGAEIDAAIVNCRFINVKADFSYSHAFGAALCEGNYVAGCDVGFYLEPTDHQLGHWIVRRNRFQNVRLGVQIRWHSTGELDSLAIESNQFALAGPEGLLSAALSIDDSGIKNQDGSPTISQIVFRDNDISVSDDARKPPGKQYGILLRSPQLKYTVGELVVERNRFNINLATAFVTSPDAGVVKRCVQQQNVNASGAQISVTSAD